MNFSNELKNKAEYNNMKYSVITASGNFSSHDNKKERNEYMKSCGDQAVAIQGRFGVVAIAEGNGKVTNEGTKKFETLLNSVSFN